MDSAILAPSCLILILSYFLGASANTEVDDLNAFKLNLIDPNGILRSWDPTNANPCGWDHVQCNHDNRVTAVILGEAKLTGPLARELGNLANLQTLELYSNNFIGRIPHELGKLTNLMSLELYQNNFSGPIPRTLGNLKRLRFLRLNNNSLTGQIPTSLTTIPTLQVLDLSYNHLTGVIPSKFCSEFTPESFLGNPGLKGGPPRRIQSPSRDENSGSRAITGGVAALLYAAMAFAHALACC